MALPPPSERGIPRRHLLATGATLFSSLATTVCGGEAERDRIRATAYAQSTAQAAPGRPRVEPTPPPPQPTAPAAPTAQPLPTATQPRVETRPDASWQTFRDLRYPFTLRYSPEWRNSGGILSMERPIAGYMDKATAFIGISGGDKPPSVTNLEQFAEVWKTMITNPSGHDALIINMKDISIAGQRGKFVLLDRSPAFATAFMLVGNKFYEITLSVSLQFDDAKKVLIQNTREGVELRAFRNQLIPTFEEIVKTAQLVR